MKTTELNDRICLLRFEKWGLVGVVDHTCPKTGMARIYRSELHAGLHDRANTAQRVKWLNSLHEVATMVPGCPVNKVGTPVVSDADVLSLTPFYRALAFALTVGIITKKEARETVEEYNKQ